MGFKKFSSIENITHLKTMQEIQVQGIQTKDWVVTEKVHGANFSVWNQDGVIKFAKRSGFIGPGENFYSHNRITGSLHAKVTDLQKVTGCDDIAVYGELFGGCFNHPEVEGLNIKSIQKGIQYSPDVEFMAFAITLNGQFIDRSAFEVYCSDSGFFFAKVLFRGTLDECLSQSNEFDSLIPAQLGYPHLKDNICEGVVIEPIAPEWFGNGSRVVLKNKNEKWSEKSKLKKEPRLTTLTDDQKLVVGQLASYVTENRLRNVLSKIGEVTQKDFGKIQGLFTQDVLEDYAKDEGEFAPKFDRGEQKLINKELGKFVSSLIRPHFRNIIDGNF